MKTPVIFRRWPKSEGGGVIAIFPRNSARRDPATCSSYEHFGQHGACDPDLVIKKTKPASTTEVDVLELIVELENYGPPEAHYDLEIKHRHTRADHEARVNEISEWEKEST